MRIHLFELEDQPWFPMRIRNFMTDFLSAVANRMGLFKGCVPILQKGLLLSGEYRILDLASGGGGGLLALSRKLKQSTPGIQIVLSDYFPNNEAFARTIALSPDVFSSVEGTIDARDVMNSDIRFRTMFQSFHHFRPNDAKQILQNAVDRRVVIGIFEAQRRDVMHFIKFAFSPLFVWLVTPLIRPFRWDRILFTYLIPIVPLCVFWDGLVSVLRTYSEPELRAMTAELEQTNEYDWEIGSVTKRQITNQYLLGWPRSANTTPNEQPGSNNSDQ